MSGVRVATGRITWKTSGTFIQQFHGTETAAILFKSPVAGIYNAEFLKSKTYPPAWLWDDTIKMEANRRLGYTLIWKPTSFFLFFL